ncbi:MAG: hypothetical protein HRT47_03385 [Candidatus Caenarcaniphilales bacterium]|nr:hypothetical protein [Candidatus Caenarcaniphilales bacterium]
MISNQKTSGYFGVTRDHEVTKRTSANRRLDETLNKYPNNRRASSQHLVNLQKAGIIPDHKENKEPSTIELLTRNGYNPAQKSKYHSMTVDANFRSSKAIMLTIMDKLKNNIFDTLPSSRTNANSIQDQNSGVLFMNRNINSTNNRSIYTYDEYSGIKSGSSRVTASLLENQVTDPNQTAKNILEAIKAIKIETSDPNAEITPLEILQMTFRITDQITANPYSANEKNLTDAVDTLTKALDIISGLTPKEAFDQTEPKEYTAPPKLNIKQIPTSKPKFTIRRIN